MLEIKHLLGAAEPWAAVKQTSLGNVQELRQPRFPARQVERPVKEPLPPPHATKPIFSFEASVPQQNGGTQPHEKMIESGGARKLSKCPVAEEFQQARTQHSILASTGCTKEFCQAGRAVHTDEPRIGENRALDNVEKEAEGFLRELHREHFFESDESFKNRLDGVLAEIRADAHEGLIREGQRQGRIGGNWLQTPAEIEFGIRRAWRNARKCIMRSHSDELRLCDLRKVTTSANMASELVQHMCEAFNGGNVLPTVFLFPPRKINSRGPMIWNHQVLEFAGYEMDDGSILGDPMSAALTKAIIELGWEPPNPRSRWDLLPLVLMADDDVPVMIEIPSPLRDLIHIRHPQYDEVGKLDLRWVTCPALTRLGFDIGGVQYTAAPFIGWFMDAEIGVRDLADTFRYNVLPDVAKALGLLNGKLDGGMEGLEDLPEYEQMSILSRAQTELTYAVTWSYQQAKVSISDTLTASTKWCRYDDEFKAKHGYRLPADPYWLAPPQGSIIPAWHRGGAPNYQPKPMISRHVQDPLKAWQREKKDYPVATKQVKVVSRRQPKRPQLQSKSKTCGGGLPARNQPRARDTVGSGNQRQTQRLAKALQDRALSNNKEVDLNQPLVSVYYCSAGTFAQKVAAKLHIRLRDLAKSIPTVSVCSGIQPLNQLQPSAITPKEVVLAVVSSTGQGEVPANGIQFIRFCDEMPGNDSETPQTGFRYAIYGNGDSRYATTYNGAAEIVEQKFRQLGGLAFAGGFYQGDTALQATALQALSPWWAKLQPLIQDLATDKPKLKRAHSYQVNGNGHVTQPLSVQAEASLRLNIRATQLEAFQTASVVKVSPSIREGYQGTYLVSLDVKDGSYEDLSCIQVLPVNTSAKVRSALRALGVNATDKICMDVSETSRPSFSVFLTEYIDLELPFQNFHWLENLSSTSGTTSNADVLRSSSCLDALEHLHESGLLPADTSLMNAICLSLPPLHPRTYSIASSLSYSSSNNRQSHSSTPSNNNHLDILVKPFPQGRFSHAFLSSPTHTSLRYKLVPSSASSLLALKPTTPLVILATGAGFAPVRSLLQRRIAAAAAPSSRTSSSSHNHQQHSSSNNNASISLFLGLKPADIPLLSDTLNEAAAAGLLDSLAVVCSNEGGVRVYDRLREEGIREKVRAILVRGGGWVFVCMNPEAARGTRGVFEEVLLGVGGVEGMGERWVEEIF